jgi:hypothetical protein
VKNKLFDRLVAQNMLLVNSFQFCFVHVVIPDAVWIDNHHRAAAANAQAVGHAAFDPLWVAQFVETILAVQFAKTPVQPFAGFRLGAVAVDTDKNVPAISS